MDFKELQSHLLAKKATTEEMPFGPDNLCLLYTSAQHLRGDRPAVVVLVA